MSTYADKAFDKSILTEALSNAIGSYAKRVRNVWNAGDSAVEDLNQNMDKEKDEKRAAMVKAERKRIA